MSEPAVTVTDRAAGASPRSSPASPARHAARQRGGRRLLGLPYKFDLVAASEPDDLVIESERRPRAGGPGVARIPRRLRDRLRRRPDRRLFQDQQPQRHRLVRLRHEFLDLIGGSAAMLTLSNGNRCPDRGRRSGVLRKALMFKIVGRAAQGGDARLECDTVLTPADFQRIAAELGKSHQSAPVRSATWPRARRPGTKWSRRARTARRPPTPRIRGISLSPTCRRSARRCATQGGHLDTYVIEAARFPSSTKPPAARASWAPCTVRRASSPRSCCRRLRYRRALGRTPDRRARLPPMQRHGGLWHQPGRVVSEPMR